MDVFLGKEKGKQKIQVYEKDLPSDLAQGFGEFHGNL